MTQARARQKVARTASEDQFPHNHIFGPWSGRREDLPVELGEIMEHVLERHEQRFGPIGLPKLAEAPSRHWRSAPSRGRLPSSGTSFSRRPSPSIWSGRAKSMPFG